MFHIITEALFLLFIVFGIFFLLYALCVKLLEQDNKNGFSVILPGYADDDRLCQKIYAAYMEANMFNLIKVNRVLVLDFGGSEKTKEICTGFFKNPEIVLFVDSRELNDIFKSDL